MIKKWALFAAIFVALQGGAFAASEGSEIGGTISGFIKKENSPYKVKETLIVPEGKALVIEAGVEMNFAEGAGLDVRGGSLAIIGENQNQVILQGENQNSWNGISITGIKRSEIRGTKIKNAEFGVALESGSLEIQDGAIENSKQAAVYVRNGFADIQWVKITDANIGVWATQGASVNLDGSYLQRNKIALVEAEDAVVNLVRSHLEDNQVALLDLGDNRLKQRESVVEQNKIGYVSIDIPSKEMKNAISQNEQDVVLDVSPFVNSLGDEPRNPYADGMKFYNGKSLKLADSLWRVSGSAGLEFGYHKVLMRHNNSHETYVSGDDSVKVGERFINYFQVPGFFINWNANLVMESPFGQVMEFAADFSGDKWDNFKVHQLKASYKDDIHHLVLGDFDLNGGELYMAGLAPFGVMYDVSLFKNSMGTPMFEGLAFVGETRKPKIEGKRNYDVYKDYVEDGEGEAQQVAAGGKIRWNMHKRFNGTLGYIGSSDYLKDPILRDGMSDEKNLLSPMYNSRAFFADGNWRFYPGEILLNGQVAVGSADTVNAVAMRAINQIFSDAGLDASNFALLNRLMKNPYQVNSLSQQELLNIFGENTLKTPAEMRRELKSLLEKASAVAKTQKSEKVKPSNGDFWSHEHWAVSGSYKWQNENTFVEGFFRYVGREYFSVGSPDLLQNTRMVGGNLDQKIFDFWKLHFGYTMNVENAADADDGYNIFGMGEGTHWGMFSGAESDWLKEHEQDENRALYIHDGVLGNSFKINNWLSLDFEYALNYRTRSTPQRLYANYTASSGIYKDDWFKMQKGKPFINVIEGNDTLKIDSARWSAYYLLSDEDYLATQFVERLMRHTFDLGLTFKLPQKNVLTVGGIFEFRKDLSYFEQDDLLDGFDFSDKTYGILGYYFGGSNYYEQRYPISLTSTFNNIHNVFSFMPRYKIYNRNDMREFEWNLMNNFDVVISKDFLETNVAFSMRQNFLSYKIENENYDETEMDFEGSATLRVHHTKSLYSDWTLGALYNYRPDSRSDEYKDFYMMAALNYEF